MRRRMMRLKDGMLEPVFKNESVVCESETCGDKFVVCVKVK